MNYIYIPAIAIAELYYLNEKKGRPLDFRTKYARLPKANSLSCCHSTHLKRSTVDACSAATEMHDRMIAADARRTKATLLTRDSQIASSAALDAFNAEGTLQPERVEMVN